MSRRRRILLLAALSVVLLTAAAWILLHSRVVQRMVTDRVTAAIEERTGWRIEIDEPHLRLWPARLMPTGVRVSAGDRRVVSIERIEATWSWTEVVDAPYRLSSVGLTGVTVDLRDLELPAAAEPPPDAAPADPWRVVEVRRLRLDDGLVEGRAMDVAGTLEGVRIAASLIDGRARAEVEARRLEIERQDRRLELGPLGLAASASADGVVVERVEIEGEDLVIQASGEVGFDPAPNGRADFNGRADLAAVLGWWDPNVASGLSPEGVLDFDGGAALDAEGNLTANLVHRGDSIALAGTDIDELELGIDKGVPVVRVAGSSWGRANISVVGDGVASVSAQLRDARVERILAFAAPQVTAAVPGPVTVSGSIDGTVSFPFTLDTLAASVDLEAVTGRGRVSVAAEGEAATWTVTRFAADAGAVRLSGSGELADGGRVAADIELEIGDVGRALALVEPWFVAPADLEPEGGPITGTAMLSGTLGEPRFSAELEWAEPVLAGRNLERIVASADGGPDTIDWSVEATTGEGVTASADGRFEAAQMMVAGSWGLALDRLEEAVALLPATEELLEVAGNVRAEGGFFWSPGGWGVDGAVAGEDLAVADWGLDRLELLFDAGPDGVVIDELSTELLGGRLSGRGEVGLEGFDAPLSLALEWWDLELGELPLELPEGTFGAVNGRLTAAGTVSRPTAEVELDWTPADPASPVPPLAAAGSLEDGVLRLVTREVATELGTAIARATVPLGSLPLPEWLWLEAPDDAIRVVADGHDLRSEPLLALLGVEPVPVSASAELTLDAEWRPGSPEGTRVFAELNGFRMEHAAGVVEAQGPLEFRIDNGRVRLEPVLMTGPQTRIEVGGDADLSSGTIDGKLDALIAPTVARLIPFPIQIYQPIHLSVTAAGTLDAPWATITIEHPGGALVMREPPLQIQDLKLSAEVVDGRLWVNNGSAEVNQGRVELGGGWDAESGQGIVAEVDNVVVFVEGILSQWSGTIAIEPEPDRLAKVTGELNLVAGLWDQDVSIGGALFGPSSLDPAGDDPLYDIALDLDVRGRGIVRVENNLGRFDARWDVLRVTGSAAEPEIRGKISIAPGGRLSLAGQRVTVRRGSLVFTGDPAVDPIMDIVPDSDLAVFGAGGDKIDTTSLATQGLVTGLAGALGFENETLQPAEISVEIEKDPSQHLAFGQRLSHNIALFFATNTTDVQDRTSMLQLWNLPGLKGLALQGYQKTLTDEAGANLFQRFQWGGTSLYEDRGTIRKLKLEGDWPISERRLKKATGFRRGQPYDPFLTFVAKVRMERELAGAGYQEATVTAQAVESNNAWTMFFECDPGPRQQVVFEGDVPPRRIRREVTALYQPAPLERHGFRNMSGVLDRHLDAEGYPEAEVAIERRGDEVVAVIDRGRSVGLSGPVVVGAPADLNAQLQSRLGNPIELAQLPTDQDSARRIVERVLADLGYPDAVVGSVTKASVDKDREEVRIEAVLGPRAMVAELVVTGDDPLGLTRSEGFDLHEGSPIDRRMVDLAASQLRAGYDAAGYSDARVSGSMTEQDTGRWKVSIHIEPGRRRRVSAVEINGTRYTRKKVLRSGVTVDEGEILKNSDLDTTAVRIANFAPIERVDVRTVPEGTDGAKIVLEVVEKPRWTTEVGAGWSTERGAQARFGIRDDNLIGRGLNLNLRGRWDQTEWLGFLVASLPPPPGRRFSFTTTGGFSRGDAPGDPNLTQDEPFWSFEVTRWMGRGDVAVGTAGEQITSYYRFSRTTTREKDPCYQDPFCLDFGTTTNTGLLGARYVHDRFDSPLDPTRGYAVVLDAATSRQILGSDFDYWTALGNGSMAMGAPLSSTWIQSLRLGLSEPLQGQVLPKTAKFFAGGQGSIRGFDRDSVGPVTYSDNGWDPNGGGALLILNEELRIPVWGGLRAALFADIGQVWTSWGEAEWNFAVGAGVGIRWATPIGPLWADVAWPVVNPDVDPPGNPPYVYPVRPMSSSKPKFYIGIGRPF